MSETASSAFSVFKGASVVFAGILLSRVLGFLSEILIIRSLSPETLGLLTLGFTIVTIISGLFITGISQGVARMISSTELESEDAQFLQAGLLLASGVGITTAVVLVLLRREVADILGKPGLEGLIPLFALYLLVHPVLKILVGALRGYKDANAVVLSKDILGKITGVGVLIFFLFLGRPQEATIVYWIGTPVIGVVFLTAFAWQRTPLYSAIRRRPNIGSMKRLVSFSAPLLISTSFLMMMSNIDLLILGGFATNREVGLYRAVLPLKEIVLFVLMSFAFLYLPIATEHFSAGETDRLGQLFRTSTKWIVWLTYPAVLLMALFPSETITVIFSSEQAPASVALTILVVAMFIRVAAGPDGTTVQAINRPRVDMYAAAVGLFVNISLNLVLVPRYGMEGAAMATLLGFVAYNTIEVVAIYRVLNTTPFSRTLYTPLIPTTLISIGIWVAVPSPGLLLLVAFGCTFGLIELLMIGLTGSIDQFDRTLLQTIGDETGMDLRRLQKILKRFER